MYAPEVEAYIKETGVITNDEINEMREYHVHHESNQFRKIVAEVFNQFAFGNGLIKRGLQDETLKQYLTV